MPERGPTVPGTGLGAGSRFLVSCEHGGKDVPLDYRPLFAGQETLLDSHRGHDPGALLLARELASALSAPLVFATTSRLLVDLNRSPRHRRLHFDTVREAPAAVRREIRERFYEPYRERAEAEIRAALAAGASRLIHISSHSFTPELDGEVRNADIGLLYDPGRPGEMALCREWQKALAARAPEFRVRRNYPYTGSSDGFCAWLRRRYSADFYVGVELEINQRFVLTADRKWPALRRAVVAALVDALAA